MTNVSAKHFSFSLKSYYWGVKSLQPNIYMKRQLFFFFFIIAFSSFAQNKAAVDTLFTNDGRSYAGTMVKMLDKDFVEFMTLDSVSHRVPVTFIRELKQVNGSVVLTSPSSNKANDESISAMDNNYWRNPKLPSSLVRKHNTGIALTVIGSVFLVGGSVIIAASPSNVRTVSNQYQSGVYFSGASALGFLMDLAAIPMTIVGIVKLTRSKKQSQRILQSKAL